MAKQKAPLPPASNFVRGIIQRELAANKFSEKKWAGSPGDAAHQEAGQVDIAKIRTRFPPEPNGYLHIGHAKSIFINFGLANDYDGVCHLRFDDTNPEKESQEYVDSITEMVIWLGFSWDKNGPNQDENNLYFASNYFDDMYRAAELLI
ncbi:MAG: glutaminyl-tRNA synthetase, partial [Methylophilaceae bacterium]